VHVVRSYVLDALVYYMRSGGSGGGGGSDVDSIHDGGADAASVQSWQDPDDNLNDETDEVNDIIVMGSITTTITVTTTTTTIIYLTHTHTHTPFNGPFFRDYPGELVPER